jgi:hypothetical protein
MGMGGGGGVGFRVQGSGLRVKGLRVLRYKDVRVKCEGKRDKG